jgi:hypothetical protein
MPSPLLVSRREDRSIQNEKILTGSTSSITVEHHDAKYRPRPFILNFSKLANIFFALAELSFVSSSNIRLQ